MPEAPRKRPEDHTVLLTLRGHIRARPKAVFDSLDRRLRPGSDAVSYYTADPAAFLIVTQGGWWYRGEYRVVPDESGSHVEHTIVNVAQRAPRISRFTARKVVAAAPAAFTVLLKELRSELE
ncbi:MAG: hypothetical protein ACYCZY_07110 [Lacisediminihabitans sp.]